MAWIEYDKDDADIKQLVREIRAASFTTFDPFADLRQIENSGSPSPAANVRIQVASALSVGDQSVMDAIIAAHPNLAIVDTDVVNDDWRFSKVFALGSAGSSSDYVESRTGTWSSVSSFRFPGTSAGASPMVARLVLAGHKTGNVKFRIYDITNRMTICEHTVNVTIDKENVQFSDIDNLPAGEAVWEIQIAKGSAKARLSAIEIE